MITSENMKIYAKALAEKAAVEECDENPLSLFSTSQLKAELKRRKEGNTINNLTKREVKPAAPYSIIRDDLISDFASDMTMVHGGMHYRCESCSEEWIMWLEIGVEDRGRHGRTHQPCPFVIRCDCGGEAVHVDWNRDIQLPGPRPIGEGMRYFSYDHSGDPMACGHATVYHEAGERR